MGEPVLGKGKGYLLLLYVLLLFSYSHVQKLQVCLNLV